MNVAFFSSLVLSCLTAESKESSETVKRGDVWKRQAFLDNNVEEIHASSNLSFLKLLETTLHMISFAI